MRSFVTIAISLALLQSATALPLDKRHVGCGNSGGLLGGVGLLGNNNCGTGDTTPHGYGPPGPDRRLPPPGPKPEPHGYYPPGPQPPSPKPIPIIPPPNNNVPIIP
ncbi:hypothetical protein PSTG_17584, partial [Puccinia striiformis f. sp. tritici PST-78]